MIRLSFRSQEALTLAVAIFALGLISGCDAVQVHTSPSEQTDDHDVRIDAESFKKADLYFDSGVISSGESFSIGLVDDQYDTPVTRITHEGLPGGQQSLKASFTPLEPTSVTVECRNDGELLYRQDPESPTSEDELEIGVATTNREPDSYHYSDNGETVIVGVDYGERTMDKSNREMGQASVKFSSSKQLRSCTHVFFVLEGVSASLSPDGVLFSGKTDKLQLQEQELR